MRVHCCGTATAVRSLRGNSSGRITSRGPVQVAGAAVAPREEGCAVRVKRRTMKAQVRWWGKRHATMSVQEREEVEEREV